MFVAGVTDPESLVVSVPDALPGDPATMRQFAVELGGACSGLGDTQGTVDAAARMPLFVGPAGERFRAEMSGCCGRLGQGAERLQALVVRVNAAADEVEASQRARRAALEQLALEQHQHDRVTVVGP
jgi:hypothetical protein